MDRADTFTALSSCLPEIQGLGKLSLEIDLWLG